MKPEADAARESRRLALPLIASNLTIPLLGLVDTGMAGHLGDPIYLGAVALGANVLSLFYFLFGFLRMMTGGLSAQAFGARNSDELSAILIRSLVMAFVIGLGITFGLLWVEPLAAQVFGVDGELRASLGEYIAIRAFGAPAALAGFVLIGWTLGHQNSVIPLKIMVVTNGVNAALDVVFVIGLDMGVDGIALATVLAEYIGLATALYLVRGLWKQSGCRMQPWSDLANRGQIARLFRLNGDFFLRSLFMEIAFLSFMALGARQGEVALAANAILHNFFTISAYGLDGFAHATEAMTGKAIGSRNQEKLKQAIRAGFWNGGILAIVASALFVLCAWMLIQLLTDLQSVRDEAMSLRFFVWIMPIVSVWAFIYDGIFFGATRSKELRNGMAMALVVFLVGCSVLVPTLGNTGLWIMMLTYLGSRGLVLAWIWSNMGHSVIDDAHRAMMQR